MGEARHGANLDDFARLVAPWATPAAHEAGGTPEQFLARKAKAKANGKQLGVSLTSLSLQAMLSAWATPTIRDHKDGGAVGTAPTNALLERQVWLASGQTPDGSSVKTGGTGQLDPRLSAWLMGLPTSWTQVAPLRASRGSGSSKRTVTRSTRSSRRTSSAPS